jgi:MFS family permease
MFMAALMVALWALRPGAREGHRWLAIAAVVVAALTRSAGLAVVAGVFLHFVLSRAWRHAAALAVASALTIVPWIAWTVMAPQQIAGRSYISDALLTPPRRDSAGVRIPAPPPAEVGTATKVATLARTIQTRVKFGTQRYLTRALPSRLAVPTVANTTVDNIAWFVVMLLALGTGLAAALSRWRAGVLALLGYALLLVLWPYAVGRFLVPMLPVFVALLLLGAWRIGVRLMPRAPLVPLLATAATLILGGSHAMARQVQDRSGCAADQTDGEMCADAASRYQRIAREVDARLPSGALVFTSKEATFFYHTERQVVSVYPVLGASGEDLASYLREREVAMIFLPHLRLDEQEFGEALAEICASLTDARSPEDEVLMLFVRPAADGEQNACDAVARWRATW